MSGASDRGAERPLVSIGLPVRNGGPSLDRALQSLLAQTERRIELIVADNGSTDETVSIVEKHRDRDPRVRFFRHDHNLGIIENFEFVLAAATGEYFMWAAHDDIWKPTFIEELLRLLESDPAARAAMCATLRVTEEGRVVDEVRFLGARSVRRPWWRLALSVARGSPHHLYIYGLYRRSFLQSGAGHLPRVAAGDRLFAVNLVMSTRLAYVDHLLYQRQVASRGLAERYADEDVGRWWTESWPMLKTAVKLGPFLLRSTTIPWWRKPFAPVLVVVFLHNRLPLAGIMRRVTRRAKGATEPKTRYGQS